MNSPVLMAPHSESLESTILDIGIPPRPAVIDLIAQEMRKDSPDFRQLEIAFKSDVALSAGIVKMANAVGFGVQHRVTSILEAMEIMGLRSMARAVACIALRSSFPSAKLDRFWDASMQIATLSAWLAGLKRWRGVSADEAYTFGLFRDCGIAVLLYRIPGYVDVLREANANSTETFTAVETSMLPINHAKVGSIMAKTWWLSDNISDGILHHHNPRFIEPNLITSMPSSVLGGAFVAISQLAEYLYQNATGLSPTKEWEKLGTFCLSKLAIDISELPDLCCMANVELANTEDLTA